MWKHLKLWKKISVGTGLLLLLLLVIGGVGVYGLSQTVEHGEEVIGGTSLRSEILQREVDHLNWVKNVSLFLLDDSVQTLSVELDHTQCGFGKWYYGKGREEAEKMLPSLKDSLQAVEEPHRRLHESAGKIKHAYVKGGSGDGFRAATSIFDQETVPNLAKVQAYLKDINELTKKNVMSDEEMINSATQARTGMIVAALVAVVFGILISWFITRSITAPIVKGVDFARSVATGDLTRTLDVDSGDEMGMLAAALNGMVQNLKGMVVRITATSGQVATAAGQISAGSELLTRAAHSQASAAEETSSTMAQMAASIQTVAANSTDLAANVDEVSSSIQELGASSEQMAKSSEVMASSVSETSATIEQMTVSIDRVAQNADELASSVSETSTTVEQMTVSIDQVAANAQELQQVVNDASTIVEEMAVSIRQVAKNVGDADDVARLAAKEGAAGQQAVQEALAAMQRVAEVTDKTAASIVNLGRRSDQIGSIVQVINEIADQTNLLALNAAIEAARAGDAGRGFAVVADEVRKLAERSVNATKEIGQVIREVQADTSDSVRYGELATQEAKASMELSAVAGNALVNIVKNIEQTSSLMSQVASMAGDQASASDQVIKAVEKMSQATAIVTNAAREQAIGGRQIRIAVERMNSITQEVTGATREQAQGSKQIRIALENMNHVTQQVNGATRGQALSAQQIVEAVKKMNTMTQVVANATAEQKRGGETVVTAVENISDLTQGNLTAVEDLGRSAESLTRQADELAQLVTQFRV